MDWGILREVLSEAALHTLGKKKGAAIPFVLAKAMPLNLGVGHTFLKTIVYLGLLHIGYSSEGNPGALPRYWSDLELSEGKVALRGGVSGRGGTTAGQSEGEVAPGFAFEGLAVESWEAQSLAWSAAAALQARSVPRGMDPELCPRSATRSSLHATVTA